MASEFRPEETYSLTGQEMERIQRYLESADFKNDLAVLRRLIFISNKKRTEPLSWKDLTPMQKVALLALDIVEFTAPGRYLDQDSAKFVVDIVAGASGDPALSERLSIAFQRLGLSPAWEHMEIWRRRVYPGTKKAKEE